MTDHRVDFHSDTATVRVMVAGRQLAATDKAVVLLETGLPPVCYIPAQDVDASILEKTSLTTHCPYKGDASYWSIRVEDHIVENAIWAYEDPIPAAMPIKGHMAFYTNKVDIYDADLPALD